MFYFQAVYQVINHISLVNIQPTMNFKFTLSPHPFILASKAAGNMDLTGVPRLVGSIGTRPHGDRGMLVESLL